MKRFCSIYKIGLALLTLCVISIGLVGCSPSGDRSSHQWSDSGKLKVLSTTAMIDDLVRQVGDDHVETLILIGGANDPHHYELVKGDNEKLLGADIIFCNGLGLEHGPSLRRFLSQSDKCYAIGDHLVAADSAALVLVDGEPDPHIWMDVSLWASGLDLVAKALSQTHPQSASVYQANAKEAKASLLALHRELKERMESISPAKRYLVTTHDAFNYFTRSYLATDSERQMGTWRERCCAPEGLAPDSCLSTTDLQAVISHLDRYRIHVLFPESNLSRDSVRKLVSAGKQRGLDVCLASEPLYGDAMGPRGSDGETYEAMMRHNGRVIASYLERGGCHE